MGSECDEVRAPNPIDLLQIKLPCKRLILVRFLRS